MTKNANQQRKNITEYLIFRFFSFIAKWNLGAKIFFFTTTIPFVRISFPRPACRIVCACQWEELLV